jgi:Ca2+-binding EF-hand superfamily protein
LVVIRTSASKLTSSHSQTSVSDINTYNLGDGTTTIRTLLGRGVGVDTTLVVGKMEEDEGGSTVIAVSAALHDDEVTEFPEEEVVEEEQSKETGNELTMLADYLADSGQTIFQFFKSIDLDDSGMIDTYEFQMALKSSKVANLVPWEMDSLIAAIDIDGDGQINLPELSIAIAKVRKENADKESTPEVEVPSKAQLNKMKKAELVELATSLGLDASGTKKDLVSLISEA